MCQNYSTSRQILLNSFFHINVYKSWKFFEIHFQKHKKKCSRTKIILSCNILKSKLTAFGGGRTIKLIKWMNILKAKLLYLFNIYLWIKFHLDKSMQMLSCQLLAITYSIPLCTLRPLTHYCQQCSDPLLCSVFLGHHLYAVLLYD